MTLLFFTSCFPFHHTTEDVFVRSELEALSRVFDRVVVIPRYDSGDLTEIGIPGVEVDLSLARHPFSTLKFLKLPWLLSGRVLSWVTVLAKESHGVGQFMRGVFFALNTTVFSRVLRRIVAKYSATDNRVLLYSYWFDLIPDALVEAVGQDIPVVTRAHRYDVFDDQVQFRSKSMRQHTLEKMKAVYVVSEHGLKYLAGRYPRSAEKMLLSRLGSKRTDDVVASPSPQGKLALLSVSRVADVKRVDRCMDVAVRIATTYPWLEVTWTHVGDGPMMRKLKKHMSTPGYIPSNLTVDMRGELPNSAVHEIYRHEPVDWFMLMSDSEGLPISICEALSYGVPVLATDVGGIAEAVTPEVGIVLPPDSCADAFVGEMQPYISFPDDFMYMRKAARKRWVEEFDSEMHSANFANKLKNLI